MRLKGAAKVWQINLQHSHVGHVTLSKIMNDEGSKSIALIQEPYLRTDGSLVKVPNYFSYGSKDAREIGRAHV